MGFKPLHKRMKSNVVESLWSGDGGTIVQKEISTGIGDMKLDESEFCITCWNWLLVRILRKVYLSYVCFVTLCSSSSFLLVWVVRSDYEFSFWSGSLRYFAPHLLAGCWAFSLLLIQKKKEETTGVIA